LAVESSGDSRRSE